MSSTSFLNGFAQIAALVTLAWLQIQSHAGASNIYYMIQQTNCSQIQEAEIRVLLLMEEILHQLIGI